MISNDDIEAMKDKSFETQYEKIDMTASNTFYKLFLNSITIMNYYFAKYRI